MNFNIHFTCESRTDAMAVSSQADKTPACRPRLGKLVS
jgi:hypothetical protein